MAIMSRAGGSMLQCLIMNVAGIIKYKTFYVRCVACDNNSFHTNPPPPPPSRLHMPVRRRRRRSSRYIISHSQPHPWGH